MENEIFEIYEVVKDKVSEKEFLDEMESFRNLNEDKDLDDITLATMVRGKYIEEKNETFSDKEEYATDKISKLEDGNNVDITGRVMSISNPKIFVTKKDNRPGKLCNLKIADDTGEIKVVFWTENIKLLKKINEGDVIQINKVDIKDGYRGLEGSLQPRSTLNKLNKEDYINFPEYKEPITYIEDLEPDTQVNVIARIIRIPSVRTFNKNGKEGQVVSLELQDTTGKTSYTLWNKDVNLIDTLELKVGDSVKILAAQVRERNGDISLSQWDGRIVKDEFDLPEFEENIIEIIDAHEQKDVSLLGIVTKIQDTITFNRKDDNSEGYVKSIEIMDDTGSIGVTLWGDDTKLEINKGDIIKIAGANIEFDEYATSGYKVNTNWNSNIITNPDIDDETRDILNEYYIQIGPVKIEEVQDADDDGEEVDIIGRVISVNEMSEFQRDDGTVGLVKSINFADETGTIRVSFWDEKAQENFKPGDAYQIENARTKMGMYAVDLNVGKISRVIKLNEEEAAILPSFKTLEEMIYTQKKIMDLEEDDTYIRVVGRIIDIQELREFQRQDGTSGLVRNMDIADNTGSIRVTLWNSSADSNLEVGQAIKLENPGVNYNNDRLELSVNNITNILIPNDDEINSLPTNEDLEEMIYKSKTVEDLEDTDSNVKISGTLTDVYGNKILLSKCPHCNDIIEQLDGGFLCNNCANEIDEPKYILMIPARLKDSTNDISITFFGKLVEELLGMDLKEILGVIEESGDFESLEEKVEDLNGLNIEVIADVNFDEYNEDIRLTPKKILSKNF